MSGLLNYLMSAADTSKRKLRSLFDDPIGNLQMSSDDNLKAFTGSIQNKLKPTQPSNMTWGQPEVNPADYLAGGVGKIVWHGSPHKFDKFDMSKIGTGEGAQAYGHGIYAAESPKVADEYAGKLSKPVIEFKNKQPQDDYERKILDILQRTAETMQYESRSSAVNSAFDTFYNPKMWKYDPLNPKANAYNKTAPIEGDELAELLKYKDAAHRLGYPDIGDTGYLYKVDIPDEAVARMLDWDKPLSEQGGVNRFASLPDFARPLDDVEASNVLGQRLHQRLSNKLGEEGARKALSDAGIPGIRYLDGGSRTAGEGTSNYVLFDDQLARILERNGTPTGLQPWNPGEWRGLLGD